VGAGAHDDGTEQKAMAWTRFAYTVFPSPLGLVLLAGSGRGLCWLGMGDDGAALEAELRRDYPRAAPVRDDRALAAEAAAVGAYLAGRGPCAGLPLDVAGTPFQLRVWEALRAVPYGETRTYGQIAAALGLSPGAARAVGAAGGANLVSLVIPCHRAVGGDGRLRGFRWGLERKAALIALERRGR
jgi:O-6-methylguanine DNA methyltransferase